MKHLLNNLSEQEKSGILEQHKGGIEIETKNFKKLTKSKLGDAKPLLDEQDSSTNTQQIPTITTKVASEGIKNVLPEMISGPPFPGDYSGYVFGGKFNGKNYSWDCNGVDGMSGVRGFIEGEIISENNSMLSKQTNQQITDADPKGIWVGFHSKNSKFVVYVTTSGKPKCVYF